MVELQKSIFDIQKELNEITKEKVQAGSKVIRGRRTVTQTKKKPTRAKGKQRNRAPENASTENAVRGRSSALRKLIARIHSGEKKRGESLTDFSNVKHNARTGAITTSRGSGKTGKKTSKQLRTVASKKPTGSKKRKIQSGMRGLEGTTGKKGTGKKGTGKRGRPKGIGTIQSKAPKSPVGRRFAGAQRNIVDARGADPYSKGAQAVNTGLSRGDHVKRRRVLSGVAGKKGQQVTGKYPKIKLTEVKQSLDHVSGMLEGLLIVAKQTPIDQTAEGQATLASSGNTAIRQRKQEGKIRSKPKEVKVGKRLNLHTRVQPASQLRRVAQSLETVEEHIGLMKSLFDKQYLKA